MSTIWTKEFWKLTAERAVKAFVAAILGTMQVADALSGGHALSTRDKLIGALTQTGISIGLSILSSGIGEKGTPTALPKPTEEVAVERRDPKDAGHVDNAGILLGLAVGLLLAILVLILR